MKVKELIAALQKLPQEMNVNVFDYRKNLFSGGGNTPLKESIRLQVFRLFLMMKQ
ncbi:MAG: hypothetical protein ACK4SB_10895 [Belliella pelovolcani]